VGGLIKVFSPSYELINAVYIDDFPTVTEGVRALSYMLIYGLKEIKFVVSVLLFILILLFLLNLAQVFVAQF